MTEIKSAAKVLDEHVKDVVERAKGEARAEYYNQIVGTLSAMFKSLPIEVQSHLIKRFDEAVKKYGDGMFREGLHSCWGNPRADDRPTAPTLHKTLFRGYDDK